MERIATIDWDTLPSRLGNYRTLVEKIDQFCQGITAAHREQIACRAGCAGCCRHLSLFPVEACNVALAIARLPDTQQRIALAQAGDDDRCPLLQAERCLIYAHRPIICRTHGLPLLIQEQDTQRIDYCPENFHGIDTLPGTSIINLELLNRSLTAINALFVNESGFDLPMGNGRLTIAELLRELLPACR